MKAHEIFAVPYSYEERSTNDSKSKNGLYHCLYLHFQSGSEPTEEQAFTKRESAKDNIVERNRLTSFLAKYKPETETDGT